MPTCDRFASASTKKSPLMTVFVSVFCFASQVVPKARVTVLFATVMVPTVVLPLVMLPLAVALRSRSGRV